MYSLSDQRPYTIPIPDPISEQHWFGSSNGWLITADCRSDIILLNPITGRRIALPPATTMQHVTLVLNEEGFLTSTRSPSTIGGIQAKSTASPTHTPWKNTVAICTLS
jgi:hypothetical protein